METLNLANASVSLARVPPAGKRPLRAWDAADEYVLEHLSNLDAGEDLSVLLINDSFGALTCGLIDTSPVVICESAAGREAIAENLSRNQLPPVEVRSIVESFDDETMFDLVVLKIPKATPQLVEILHRIRPHLSEGTQIIGAGMVKSVHNSTIDAFEKIIGPTSTSLAKKKARLLHATFDPTRTPKPNPWPKTWKAHGQTLTNFGGGFSPNKLDPGTALLLDSVRSIEELIPESHGDDDELFHVVDLGCGNGVLGLCFSDMARQLKVAHRVTATDDSALALAAARASWADSVPEAMVDGPAATTFHHAHRLVNVIEPGSADLVIINPPFHEDRVLGDETAWSMFVDAHKVLRPDGDVLVVGNRHLAYHAKLKKIFGDVHNVASNAKFVVLQATRDSK